MHDHAHHHHHAPASRQTRAFAAGVLLNAAFVIAEIMAGLQAKSLSLLADAGHNASDVLGLSMAWGAQILSQKQPTKRFTYGYQSASIFAALANALLLLVAVGGIGYEAFQRFAAPEAPATTTVMAVAAIGVAINGVTAWMLFKGNQDDLNTRSAFLHMVGDAAISLGVVLSGALIMATGALWIDPLASLIIVILIADSTWPVLKRSVSLALHGVPHNVDMEAVRQHLQKLEGVRDIHDLHVWAMSTTVTALSVHLVMPEGHPGDSFLHTLSHDLEHRFRINHATFQIEIHDAGPACHADCTTSEHSHH